jgi:hypothetical protein
MSRPVLVPLPAALAVLPISDRRVRELAQQGRAPWLVRRPGRRPLVDLAVARDYWIIERGVDIMAGAAARAALPDAVFEALKN